MRIALDVMGGDFAPQSPIEGAILAAKAYPDTEVILVGQEDVIKSELAKHKKAPSFEIVHASEVIEMDDHPAQAAKKKKDSSMVVGMKLVKNKEADAFFSAGNTGGMLAAGIFHMKRIRGIKRPALSGLFPTMKGHTFLLDVGANADVKPEYLQQFALMGSLYVERVLKRPNPTVAIMSNGEEEGKGSKLVLEAYDLIKQLPINFQGNAEGHDLAEGKFDVIVTDGFTGNVMIKTAEGIGTMVKELLTDSFKANPLTMLAGALFYPFGYKKIKKAMDPDEAGGAPLLGLNGVALVGHGSSSPYAFQNGIRAAKAAAESKIVEAIVEGLAELKAKEQEQKVQS
ncbi:MAG: phosphate acyltransferase PlsX [Ardenticatenaceae bacterium]